MASPIYARQRRRFIKSAAALGLLDHFAFLAPAYARSDTAYARELRVRDGEAVDLVIEQTPISVAGRSASAVTINGTVPGPLLRFREGETVTLRVVNRLQEDTSIHWHGLLVPSDMDGVPGINFPGIRPGETFTYRYRLRQNGTYWYHSHSAMQEQKGHYAPMIIDPASADPVAYDREYVVMLSDWTFMDAHQMFGKLKKQADYFNYQQRSLIDLAQDAREIGWQAVLAERAMWAQMRMDPTDVLDVTGATYTYLVNGLPPDGNWTGLFMPGERVRLRFINAAAMTYFNVRIPGLPMTVVQADGQNVRPLEVDEFQIAVAETYDVIVQPRPDQAYTVFAESLDRSGYARGTLAPRLGMAAAVPPLRERPLRSMVDMGMNMDTMDMPGTGEHSAGSMSAGHGSGHASGPAAAGDEDKKRPPASSTATVPATSVSPMDHGPGGRMPGMAHGEQPAQSPAASAMDHEMHGGSPGASTPSGGGHDPAQPAMPGMSHGATSGSAPPMQHGGTGMAGMNSPINGRHGPDTHGPGNVSVAEVQRNRLGEPGIGLENVPHRVLVYNDLKAIEANRDPRPHQREIEMHLTSNMEAFMWSIDGKKFSESGPPPKLLVGERVRLTLVNDTMMEHPMHLHGVFWEVDNGGDRAYRPRKHTISVKPAERVSLDFTYDEPGNFAFHCHMLFHMEAGMFRFFNVSNPL